MSGYPFYNPAPVLLDLPGLAPAAGGSLYFYELGSTTLKNTFSCADLYYPNENPVPLDSAGRTKTRIWLDGAYSVVLKSASGATIWTREVDSGLGAGATIPDLLSGQFLTNDGSNLLWTELLQVPDPTDSANSILSNDGSNLLWIPQEEIPDPDVVISTSAKSVTIGTSDSTTKYFMQCGTSSAPASGSENTSISVTFPTAFGALWHVDVEQTHDGVSAYSTIPQQTLSTQSTTGFTVRFSTDENSTSAGWTITSAVPFSWMAVGTIEVAKESGE